MMVQVHQNCNKMAKMLYKSNIFAVVLLVKDHAFVIIFFRGSKFDK